MSHLKPKVLVRVLGTVCFFALLPGLAFAPATIVLGKLYVEPETPEAGAPFTLRLEMVDPSQVPLEDAIVLANFQKNGQSTVIETNFTETVAGTYLANATLDESGEYTLLMRDQTFRQEEARASLSFFVGEGQNEIPIAFVFPPTATGNNNLFTWLIWLIAVPVVAGIVVTVVVLMNSRNTAEEDD